MDRATHPWALLALCAALTACGPGPGTTTSGTGTNATTTSATTAVSATTSTAGTTTTTTTTAGPTTTTTGAGVTTTTGTTGATDTSSTTAGVVHCGPPCDEYWTHEGGLTVLPGDDPADYACLERITGGLTIEGHTGPEVLAGLRNLKEVGSALHIRDNSAAVDLSQLECLQRVEATLSIIANKPDFETIDGLQALESVGSFNVSMNPGLGDLGQLAFQFDGLYAQFSITHNPSLTTLDGLALTVSEHGVTIIIHDNDVLGDLSGLETAVDGSPFNLHLVRMPALESLTGLEPATDVFNLYLAELPALTSLAGLSGVTEIYRADLFDLPALASLNGLGGLERITELNLGDCGTNWPENPGLDVLTSLDGLDSLLEIESLTITHNPTLNSLAGAPNLTTLGSARFWDNPALTQQEIDAFTQPFDTEVNLCEDPETCTCPQVNPP